MRPLPRPILWVLCLVYVCAGFIGRHPWKNEDVASYGFMQAVAQGGSPWLKPELIGHALDPAAGWLPVWLGACALRLAPTWIAPEFAVRLPFMAAMLLSFALVWFATYYLARRAKAQPVPFAFGGEANPVDYARAIADGSVLALVACLGLIQFSHETSATLVQLAGASLLALALALPQWRWRLALALVPLACLVLVGSGGWHWLLAVALSYGALECWRAGLPAGGCWQLGRAGWLLLCTLLTLALAHGMELPLHWPLVWPLYGWSQWRSIVRLLIWFGWPAWPLACWALYRWRRHVFARQPSYHVALPLCLVVVTVVLALCSEGSARDRTLFLSLPMAAMLAAFALPTMRRSVSSLIDWFTLLFFTACGSAIWVIWTATQTGVPAKPAANVARLAPEYLPQFSGLAFALAALATLVWLAVIVWRTGRHRAALWKSLVLPAGGATWCVILVMTLWLPMLDYGRSFQPQIEKMARYIPPDVHCIWSQGLRPPQLAAFWAQAGWPLRASGAGAAAAPGRCPMALLAAEVRSDCEPLLQAAGWRRLVTIERPTSDEAVTLFVPANGIAALPAPVHCTSLPLPLH